jgi:anti-sigma-K factor RskA
MDRETFLNLIPAYALGALDDDERAEFEARIADDAEGRTLLAEYQEVAQALIMAAPVREAPAHLGADLRKRLKTEPPVEHSEAEPEKATGPIWTRWLSAAAILALLFGVIWGLTQLPTESLPEGQQLYHDLNAMSSATRLNIAPGEEFINVSGQLVANPGSTQAVIQVANLPQLGEDQTYQLWLAGPDGVISGGLFQALSSDAPTYVVLPLELPFEDYQGFGVSLEPAGGSPFPDQRSGPRVFNVRLEDT